MKKEKEKKMLVIDAMGKACPIPVIMAKKEIDGGKSEFIVTVDNKIAVENLKKLATSQGFGTEVEEKEGTFYVSFAKGCEACEKILEEYETHEEVGQSGKKEDYTVFIGKDYIGEGDHTLGRSLIQMFLYTLTESDKLPTNILFMNTGVKLTVEDEQCIEHLKELEKKNVSIIVCGTCLNYFGIADQLQVGTISNMYDIVETMQNASKVITI